MSNIEPNTRRYLSLEEQETHISWMRTDSHATIYTSDSTQMTRLDRLGKTNPDIYSLLHDKGVGKIRFGLV